MPKYWTRVRTGRFPRVGNFSDNPWQLESFASAELVPQAIVDVLEGADRGFLQRLNRLSLESGQRTALAKEFARGTCRVERDLKRRLRIPGLGSAEVHRIMLHPTGLTMAELLVPISPGELIDKITILEIKLQRMTDAAKLLNVRTELALLTDTWRASAFTATDICADWAALCEVNGRLWDIEDRIRDLERVGNFGELFIELARAVYFTNDERAALKKRINAKLGSTLLEEKSYADYAREGNPGFLEGRSRRTL